MSYTLLHRDELPHDGNTYEFQGIQHPDTNVSFIWVDMPPGGTIRLHKHPYPCGEIFIIQESVATFTVDAVTLNARAGQVTIVPAEVPHTFMNSSDKQLKQFSADWLED